MKPASILWIILLAFVVVFSSSLYVIRATCYNRTVAEITKQQLSDRNKDCKPSLDVSLTVQKMASHIYFSLMFIIPVLFFVCFVVSFKQRAKRVEDDDKVDQKLIS